MIFCNSIRSQIYCFFIANFIVRILLFRLNLKYGSLLLLSLLIFTFAYCNSFLHHFLRLFSYLSQYPSLWLLQSVCQSIHFHKSHSNNSSDQIWAHYHSNPKHCNKQSMWSRDWDVHYLALALRVCNAEPVWEKNER